MLAIYLGRKSKTEVHYKCDKLKYRSYATREQLIVLMKQFEFKRNLKIIHKAKFKIRMLLMIKVWHESF